MTTPQVEIQVIASLTAVASALCGTFLVLRRMAMMSDAISHAILPGIAIAFLLVHDLSSPLLVIAAAITGVVTVSLVELLGRTGLIKEDAAIGLVFPALFSIGVILISRHAGDVHLDVDAVLLGELAFAPFDRFTWGATDLGPRSLWVMGGILLLNVFFILLFFKELKIATFDPGLAAALGFAPGVLHYALMGVVSTTAVGAFDAVGSILVVALMIGPPVTAYLLTDRLSVLLALAGGIGVLSALGGYWLAHWLDASIAGSMATVSGLVFGVTWLFAPGQGLVASWTRRRRMRWEFAEAVLAIHVMQHQGLPEASEECRPDRLTDHLRWTREFSAEVVNRSLRHGLLEKKEGLLELTGSGVELAREHMRR